MIWQEDGQASLFDQDTEYGKMYSDAFLQDNQKAEISKRSSKNSAKSQTGVSLFLNLTNGQKAEPSWEMDSAWLGQYTLLKTGAFPKEERAYQLSQILEESPLPKYCLSARACQGILNRAEKRGKTLPEILETALKDTISKASVSKNEQGNPVAERES